MEFRALYRQMEELDSRIVELLERRAEIAGKIGTLSPEQGVSLPAWRVERETLRRVVKLGRGALTVERGASPAMPAFLPVSGPSTFCGVGDRKWGRPFGPPARRHCLQPFDEQTHVVRHHNTGARTVEVALSFAGMDRVHDESESIRRAGRQQESAFRIEGLGRGRDARYRAPTAQIRACGTTAHGS